MKSPKLVTVLKIPLDYIIENNYNLSLTRKEIELYEVEQQNNQLFDFVNRLTKNKSKFIDGIVFIDCKNYSSKVKKLEKILNDGFYINGNKYVLSEKSASMSRQSVTSMVLESIYDELERIIMNGVEVKETVLAKFLAYRGLTLSSSFSLGENFNPYVIVVDDYECVIPSQNVRCLVDEEKQYIDKNTGELKTYKEKKVVDKIIDATIMPMDGWGVHSKKVTQKIKEIIEMKENPTTVMWRNAYFKGLTSEIDFVDYCENVGIYEIEDVYGKRHSIYDIDIIATKSMFKGYNYYVKFGKTYKDWEYYLENCKKNGYTWRIAKWTYSFEDEPRATRFNYQHLQCLDLDFDNFIKLADYSKQWIERILNGDKIYLYAFLGLMGDNLKPSNSYMKALLKNYEMTKDPMIKKYLNKILKKNIDQMKIGKIYMVDSAFKTAIPDVILFLEYITKQKPKGVLEADEFYAVDINGIMQGEYFVGRNPKISRRENCKLKGSNYDILNKYASHLSNTVMINAKSTTMARLQGADSDGDAILLSPAKIIVDSIDMSLPIIMDVEDKITAKKEVINKENIVANTIRSFKSLIGEYSNYASAYNNRVAKTLEQKQKNQDYVDILSVCSGKSLDYCKTGVLYLPPKNVIKYGKPLPYFMKYISSYYAKMNRFSYSPSNMTLLCRHLEKWEKTLKYNSKKSSQPFDYTIMLDLSIQWNAETYSQVEELYQQFLLDFKELKKQQRMSYKSPEYYNYFSGFSYNDIKNTNVDWKSAFEKYKKEARKICSNQKELANYAVTLCYADDEKNTKEKNFAWIIAEEGIVANIKPQEIKLPVYDLNGDYEYLGKRYKLVPFVFDESVERQMVENEQSIDYLINDDNVEDVIDEELDDEIYGEEGGIGLEDW